jgi:transforming growth factor-beta-induced protein
MKSRKMLRGALAVAALSLIAVACGDDDADTVATEAPMASEPMTTEAPMTSDPMTSEPMTSEPMTTEMAEMMPSSEACTADEIVAAVQGGESEGTLEGMTDDPVATAASNNPVLTTLVTAVGAAGLGDTLNGAEALTVFAPTDCAFAALDPATLEAALADPTGLLTTVLGFHVIPERLEMSDLAGMTELTTFTGEVLPIEVDGDTVTLNDGAAMVVVGEIQTANATVYLIDNVMLPPSVTG